MRRTLLVVTWCVAAGWAAAAFQATEPVDAAMNAKIRDEGLNRSQAGAYFTTVVDTFGPRLTGSTAHKRSAEWARDTMATIGLTDARLEPWEFGRGWELDRQTIEMIEPRYMPLMGYAEAWSPSTSGEVVATAVLTAGKSPDEIRAIVAGAPNAAVFSQAAVTNFITTDRAPTLSLPDPPPAAAAPPAPATPARGGQAGAGRGAGRGNVLSNAQLKEAGAAVLIRPSRGVHGTVFVQAAQREAPNDPLPKIVLAGEHYNMIVRLLQQKVPVKLRVNVQARFLEDRNSYNVLAELPGRDATQKDEVVMLGAHLDSWHTATGATDNADGVAVALEAFRILKAINAPMRRTLRLALWSGEEEGLYGSKAWVAQHLAGDANAAARQKFDVYFNIDPGRGPIYGWFMQNSDVTRPIFDAWLKPFTDLGAVRNVPQPIGNTDHLSFIDVGVPGFNPIQDYVDYDVRLHHTNADLYERVDEKDLRQNAIVLASFMYHAANRAEKVPSSLRR